MPSKKTSKRDKGQTLAESHLPAANAALPAEQPKAEHTHAHDPANNRQEKQQMTAILAPSALSLWMQTWLPIIFSFLVIVVIIVQAYIYKKQWGAMRGTLEEMKLSREMENRAWIGVKSVEFEEDPHGGYRIAMAVVNGGNTPANVTIEYVGRDLDGPPPDDASYGDLANKPSQLVLFPHQEFRNNLVSVAKPPVIVNPKTPGHAWYIYGTLKYDDIFGHPHSTKFCYFTHVVEMNGHKAVVFAIGPTHNKFD